MVAGVGGGEEGGEEAHYVGGDLRCGVEYAWLNRLGLVGSESGAVPTVVESNESGGEGVRYGNWSNAIV